MKIKTYKSCKLCNKKFPMSWKNSNGKRVKSHRRKLCFSCSPYKCEHEKKAKYVNTTCFCCKKNIIKNTKEISESGFSYCSRSCAAIINNTKHQKRYPEKKCKNTHCNNMIVCSRTYCKECFTTFMKNHGVQKATLAELFHKRTGSNRYSEVRHYARKTYEKSNRPQCCAICGYSKYIEIHHIKSISSFPIDTPIDVVNDLSNLIALCPNHHKEIDKGIISEQEIKKIISSF